MGNHKTAAIELLTETHVRMLGSSLKKVIPIPSDGQFDSLLKALDKPGSSGTRNKPEAVAPDYRKSPIKRSYSASGLP